MLFRCLSADVQKLRRSMIWLAVLTLPLFSALLGTFNYLGNLSMLTEQWYSLWTQLSLFYCALFGPALTGVYCAYVCRLEHLNHNWNTVMTMPTRPACIFFSKLAIVSALSLLTQVLMGLYFVLAGKIIGLTAPLPLSDLLLWLLRGWCGLTVNASILLCVALVIRSFAIPVGAGLLGGFVGLAMFLKGFGPYYPFSLTQLGMCANQPAEPMPCSPTLFAASCVFYLLIGCAFGILWLSKRDVKTA